MWVHEDQLYILRQESGLWSHYRSALVSPASVEPMYRAWKSMFSALIPLLGTEPCEGASYHAGSDKPV